MSKISFRMAFLIFILMPINLLPVSLCIHFVFLSAVVLLDIDWDAYVEMISNWNLIKPWQWYNDVTSIQAQYSLGFTMGYTATLLIIAQLAILVALIRRGRRVKTNKIMLNNQCLCEISREYMKKTTGNRKYAPNFIFIDKRM